MSEIGTFQSYEALKNTTCFHCRELYIIIDSRVQELAGTVEFQQTDSGA